ncbi:methyltransferase [Paludibacterium denitrificans]|uniref:methyltransferase n=1 Tax=Paludibacterium denitrificans TaxID=2675226 RepID=UPI001E436A9E|nr:methyltransferase [Paludibacterium denitrificans]
MNWRDLSVSACGKYHECDGQPAYSGCFDEVLKFHAPGLAPVKRGDEARHIGPDGNAAYSRRFIRTFGFYEGFSTVQARDGWHHIRPDGSDAYPERYDWSGNFQGERCTVRLRDGRYRHVRSDGSFAYPETRRYAGDYKDGFCVIQNDAGLCTHLDLNGKPLHGNWFTDLDVFHKGFARARDGDGWMHVDLRGVPAYVRRFAAVEPFYNGQARVERFDGGTGGHQRAGATHWSNFALLDSLNLRRFQAIWLVTGALKRLRQRYVWASSRPCLAHRRTSRKVRALQRWSHATAAGPGELRLVERNAENWGLSVRGEFLLADHPLSLADAALEYSGALGDLWSSLSEALKAQGDWRAPDIFGDVARDPARLQGHHLMLRSYARHDYALIPDALGLQGRERVVDAGGGFGTLGMNILSAYPDAHVTVLDKPEVVEQARNSLGLVPGLNWLPGDLFEPRSIRADVVILARVLHDWDDGDAIKILGSGSRCPLAGRATFHHRNADGKARCIGRFV